MNENVVESILERNQSNSSRRRELDMSLQRGEIQQEEYDAAIEQCKFRQNDYNSMMKAVFESIPNPSEKDKIRHENSIHGGNCPDCSTEWVRKEIRMKLLDYVCYEPQCNCENKDQPDTGEDRNKQKRLDACRIPKRYLECTVRTMDREKIEARTIDAINKIEKYIKDEKYNQNGIVIMGDVGTGKTHIAVSILKMLVLRKGMSGLFVKTAQLGTDIIKSKNNVARNIGKNDVVLFDDIDKIGSGNEKNDWIKNQLYSIIDDLVSENKLIIATTNLKTVDELQQVLGTATISRILYSCIIVLIEGFDYRLIGLK